MNTLRGMYDGTTQRPDLSLLDQILMTLRHTTGQPLGLQDVLQFTPSPPEAQSSLA